MPIYEYRCENDHLFEVMQRMADEPLQACTICGAPVQRVFHPVAVHFKGSGFYNTDYGKQKKGAPASDGSGSSNEGKSESKSDSSSSSSSSSSKDSGGSDKKTATAGD
jgi:putative FmdB family regulatory protein